MSGPAFAASAANGAYRLAASTAFLLRVPNERRAQAFGIASMGLIVGQGTMLVAACVAAELVTPAIVITLAGGLSAVAALVLALSWRRVPPLGGRHAAMWRSAHAAPRRSSVP